MDEPELLPHLFRTEYARICVVLCSHFGIEYMETAEDIASETFRSALETWQFNGVPNHPKAWLYKVAKNKALNHFKRKGVFNDNVLPRINTHQMDFEVPDFDLSDDNCTDSQLRMLFAICHPVIAKESQIALALRILCGFGVAEVAEAFLTTRKTINKRLYRAKEKLRSLKIKIEYPGENEMGDRLETVITAVYLLFSEGYYSRSQHSQIRKDLCLEAMRLAHLLVQNHATNTHASNALLALICFHSSRLDARQDLHGNPILYEQQEKHLWNPELIANGNYYLQQSAQWQTLSKYYLEASIAYWHTISEETTEKWESILELYDRLHNMDPSPMIALNRAYALMKVAGKAVALESVKSMDFGSDHFYFLLLGELHSDKDPEEAARNYTKALHLARTAGERKVIRDKILKIGPRT